MFNLFKKKEKKEDILHIKFKKLDPRAVIPTYAHHGDVCMDMTAIDVEYDVEHDMYIYHTGLAFASDFNVGQFLFMRSGNCKTDAYLCNGVGVADSALYRGEIQFRYKNRDSLESKINELSLQTAIHHLINAELVSSKNKKVEEISHISKDIETLRGEMLEKAKNLDFAPYKVGDRVGQMVFLNYKDVELEEVEELNDTVRGTGGFGSTGN